MWRKYVKIAQLSWASGFVYRTNFVMWRLRMVLQLLAVYFLWNALIKNDQLNFGYAPQMLFTYILGTALMRSIVLSSRSIDAQTEISTGELSNYLLKPINYFYLWASRDISDKVLNILFCAGELAILLFLLKPSIFIQSDIVRVGIFILSAFFATVLYFFFSFIVSMTTFWHNEANGWPQRFLALTILEFFIGGLFPLDMLPEHIFNIIKYLPTSYFFYFPLQIYLGKIDFPEIWQGMAIVCVWAIIFQKIAKTMWVKGTKSYQAFGR